MLGMEGLRARSQMQGGVSITSISRTTLGTAGERATTVIYITLHYALLVACACNAACCGALPHFPLSLVQSYSCALDPYFLREPVYSSQPSDEHADTAKSGELLQQIFGGSLDAPVTVYSVGFCGLLAALCYGLRPAQLDKANTGLLGAVFVSFAVRPPLHTQPSFPHAIVIEFMTPLSGVLYRRCRLLPLSCDWFHAGPCVGSVWSSPC